MLPHSCRACRCARASRPRSTASPGHAPNVAQRPGGGTFLVISALTRCLLFDSVIIFFIISSIKHQASSLDTATISSLTGGLHMKTSKILSLLLASAAFLPIQASANPPTTIQFPMVKSQGAGGTCPFTPSAKVTVHTLGTVENLEVVAKGL